MTGLEFAIRQTSPPIKCKQLGLQISQFNFNPASFSSFLFLFLFLCKLPQTQGDTFSRFASQTEKRTITEDLRHTNARQQEAFTRISEGLVIAAPLSGEVPSLHYLKGVAQRIGNQPNRIILGRIELLHEPPALRTPLDGVDGILVPPLSVSEEGLISPVWHLQRRGHSCPDVGMARHVPKTIVLLNGYEDIIVPIRGDDDFLATPAITTLVPTPA